MSRRWKVNGTAALALGMLTAIAGTLQASDYFPLPESQGGWRKNVEPEFIRSHGLDPENVDAFGGYNLSIPSLSHIKKHDYHEHTGALVIKDGWIVGEWYWRPDGADYMNYLSSIGKSFALACFGIAELDGLEGRIPKRISRESRVYDPLWLEQGFPLSDPRKLQITFEQVFQHTSGICPQSRRRSDRGEWARPVDGLRNMGARTRPAMVADQKTFL